MNGWEIERESERVRKVREWMSERVNEWESEWESGPVSKSELVQSRHLRLLIFLVIKKYITYLYFKDIAR